MDAACVVFALWTLACHAASFLGGSLWAALLGGAVLGVLAVVWRLSPAGRAPLPPAIQTPEGPTPGPQALRWGAASAGLGVALLLLDRPVALWWASLAVLGVAAFAFLPRNPGCAPAAASRRQEAVLWTLSLLCVVVALVSHRVDIDDAFYVNLALAAVEAPGLPVLAGDTMHGVPGLPLHMPVYRLHAWELWNAALALLTGLPAIAVFHVVSAAAVAALAPLALARLLRLLSPGFWLAAVAATLWVLLVSADTHRWYANFGLVRIWQGKAVLLMVLLPLLQAYAIAFVRRPSLRGFLLLAAGQVAAVGATSTALWVAPASALAAAACAVPISWRGLQRLALVLVSSVYVLGVGLVVKAEVDAVRRADRAVETSQEVLAEARQANAERHAPGAQLGESLASVTGDGPLRAAAWGALLVTWAVLPAGLGRRFAIGVPLAVLAVLLNPYWSRFLAESLIGPSLWRAFWALPIPLLLGLLLTAPLGWAGPGRRWGGAAAVAAAVLFGVLLPRHATLAEANGVELRSPGLKVPPEAFALAQTFAEAADPGAFVVAPPAISVWLPTLHPRTYPLMVRDLYLHPYRRELGEKDLRWRVLMSLYSEGQVEDRTAPGWFKEGLDHFDVQAVFLWVTPEAVRTRRLLERAGFRPERKNPEWEIWIRD